MNEKKMIKLGIKNEKQATGIFNQIKIPKSKWEHNKKRNQKKSLPAFSTFPMRIWSNRKLG
jgi:hypothetical protein